MIRMVSHPLEHMTSSGIGIEHFSDFISSTPPDRHTHQFIEMLYVARGTITNIIDETVCEQQAGDLAIINYGRSHILISSGAELFNVYLDLTRFPFHALSPETARFLYNACSLHPSLVHRQNRIRRIHLRNPQQMTALLEMADREMQGHPAGYETAVYSLLQLILLSLMRSSESDETEKDTHPIVFQDSLKRIEEVRTYIDTEYMHQIRLSELASRFGFAQTYLCRRFKTYTGKTLTQYIIDRRLQHAMYLLHTTRDKIISVAAASGFSDLSNFNRQFKRQFGQSPGTFRKGPDVT